LVNHISAGLVFDPGLGKTSTVLAAFKFLLNRGKVKRALVIAPLRVCTDVWPIEIQKWADFNRLSCVVLHGKDKDKLIRKSADIYIINPEGLQWLLAHRALPEFDVLVVDELTKFKHTNTARFKLLKRYLGRFGRRWGLTGSLAANGLHDLFGQCYVLDSGRTFGPYITHYRNTYFRLDVYTSKWTPLPGAEEKIYHKIAPLMLRADAADYVDLPDLIKRTIPVELPNSARKQYDEMEELFITQVKEGVVTAKNAGVASAKCRQIASGGLYLEDVTRSWSNVHMAKADALAELVDELQGHPLLVAYDFIHDRDRINTALGYDVPYIGGGVSTKRSSDLVAQWNSGVLPVLLGHPQSIGHGLNLQASGNHICWFSITWNFELYDQFIRRIWRQGKTADKVFVHHLVARDTIDEIILYALGFKNRCQQALYTALKTVAIGASYE